MEIVDMLNIRPDAARNVIEGLLDALGWEEISAYFGEAWTADIEVAREEGRVEGRLESKEDLAILVSQLNRTESRDTI